MQQDLLASDDERLPTTISRVNEGSSPAYWSGVFAMTLCVFSLIASEFMPVSLLTPIADNLRISEGLAGQGIAISGAFAVFTSLFISVLAGSLNRKTLLLGLTATMGVSGAIVAMAPNYFTYMVGRALIGVVVGGFWSMSAAIAMRLVPLHRVPRAFAIFNGGGRCATGGLFRGLGGLARCFLLFGSYRHYYLYLAMDKLAFYACGKACWWDG